MAAAFEDLLLDFDLNLLSGNALDSSQNKPIFNLKKRILAINILINKYNAQRELSDHTQKLLIASTEECKQICIKYNNVLQRNELLEKELQKLNANYQELEEKCATAENCLNAAQSYTKQLQILLKQHEKTIESLKAAYVPERVNVKKEKNVSLLTKEKDYLTRVLSSIAEVVFRKRKLTKKHKNLLKKYYKESSEGLYVSDEENSGSDSDIFEDCYDTADIIKSNKENIIEEIPKAETKTKNDQNLKERSAKSDTDEPGSVDTGRGSSLAFSDSDKCLHSPDYYMTESPQIIGWSKVQQTNSATSPITVKQFVDVALSPVMFENPVIYADNKKKTGNISSIFDETPMPVIAVDDTSSTLELEHTSARSDDTSLGKITESVSEKGIENKKTVEQEKQCLESNNTENISDQDDQEIEMILKSMQLSHKPVTPLPPTPVNKKAKIIPQLPGTQGTIWGHESEKFLKDQKIMKSNVSSLTEAVLWSKEDTVVEMTESLDLNQEVLHENKSKELESEENQQNPNIEEDTTSNKKNKRKKLSNLEKLRNKMLPRSKIKADVSPPCSKSKNKIMKADSSSHIELRKRLNNVYSNQNKAECITSLYDRNAYEKAVKVMKELNAKQKENSERKTTSESNINNTCDLSESNLTSKKSSPKSVQPSRILRQTSSPGNKRYSTRSTRSSCEANPKKDDEGHLAHSNNITIRQTNITADSPQKTNRKKEKIPKSPTEVSNFVLGNLHDTSTVSTRLARKQASLLFDLDSNSTHDYHQENCPKPKENSPLKTPNFSCILGSSPHGTSSVSTRIARKQKSLSFDLATPNNTTADSPKKEKVPNSPTEVSNFVLGSPHGTSTVSTRLARKRASLLFDLDSNSTHESSKESGSPKENSPPKTPNFSCKLGNSRHGTSSVSTRIARKPKRLSFDLATQNNTTADSPPKTNQKKEKIPKSPTEVSNFVLGSPHGTSTVSTRLARKRASLLFDLDSNSTHDYLEESPPKENSPPKTPNFSCKLGNSPHGTSSVSTRIARKPKRLSFDLATQNNTTADSPPKTNQKKEKIPKSPTEVSNFVLGRPHDTSTVSTRLARKRIHSLSFDNVSVTPADFNGKIYDFNIDNTLKSKKSGVLKCTVPMTVSSKRVLRSSTRQNISTVIEKSNLKSQLSSNLEPVKQNDLEKSDSQCKLVSYNDLDMFSDGPSPKKKKKNPKTKTQMQSPESSILCKMITKYGISSIKMSSKKNSESVVNSCSELLEDGITQITKMLLSESKCNMNLLVEEIETWDFKVFLRALMKYLMKPARKLELFNKIMTPPAPPMTRSEQVLLYILPQLQHCWADVDVIHSVLQQIEYSLFKLNQTPEFDVIESMSHFYAVLCCYINARTRLRLFVLNAMYCMKFKSVIVVRQCLDVAMHILPLAHMGTAKTPLVTILVYLLHFYKCEDKFNRAQDIRNILSRKYFYQVTEWNESKILELVYNAIIDQKASVKERKMLRLALIILAKRLGPQWCQNKLINDTLLPIISKENVAETTKAFCVSIIGPLVKPHPKGMKIHIEILINRLIDMLGTNDSCLMQEAIITSLICLNKHNETRVLQVLLSWWPQKLFPETESVLRDFVKEKPLVVWKAILAKIARV